MERKGEVKLRVFDNYMSFIKGSIKAQMFRNLYADVNGDLVDITKDGDLSCAYFVSSVLLIFGLIEGVHATVGSTVKDMEAFGWVETEEPKPGYVIVWGVKKDGNKEKHRHIGFVISDEVAISNNYKERCPAEHSLALEGREIERFLKIEALRPF